MPTTPRGVETTVSTPGGAGPASFHFEVFGSKIQVRNRTCEDGGRTSASGAVPVLGVWPHNAGS
ncbi:MAG: hypothetical protein DMG58_16380 [Acidobacteria bacterium]|nr:MAG: hypothetical protein DMG58_16380 [Acidobacteriota bacterium]